MVFNKITSEILELHNKLEIYQIRSNKLKELLTNLVKEHLKLSKKLEKETDDINKLYIQINLVFIKRMIDKLQSINKDSVKEIKEGNDK